MPSAYHQSGMLCAGKIWGEWTRGVIINKRGKIVKVFFFDYGTTCYLAEDDVKFLLDIFAELPKQAIRGCLSNVQPVGKGRLWDLKVSEKFLEIVTNKVIWAKIVKVLHENILELVIVDTNQNPCSQQNISNLLVTEGLAEFHLNSAQMEQNMENFGPFCQNYPSFLVLETTEYPSYEDRWDAMQKGIDLNMLENTNFLAFCKEYVFDDPVVLNMFKSSEIKHNRENLSFNGVLPQE